MASKERRHYSTHVSHCGRQLLESHSTRASLILINRCNFAAALNETLNRQNTTMQEQTSNGNEATDESEKEKEKEAVTNLHQVQI